MNITMAVSTQWDFPPCVKTSLYNTLSQTSPKYLTVFNLQTD